MVSVLLSCLAEVKGARGLMLPALLQKGRAGFLVKGLEIGTNVS